MIDTRDRKLMSRHRRSKEQEYTVINKDTKEQVKVRARSTEEAKMEYVRLTRLSNSSYTVDFNRLLVRVEGIMFRDNN